MELSEVLRRHWPAYERARGAKVLPSQRRAVAAILQCRTPALGGQRWRCAEGHEHFAFHSCNHRGCPKCGHAEAQRWIQRQQRMLLPDVPYFLATFTVPEDLRATFLGAQRLCYGLLLREAAGALADLCAGRQDFEPGMVGVLHTWSRTLAYHPHAHFVVPGGGLTPGGGWRRVKKAGFLVSTKPLARRFRARFSAALKKAAPELWKQVAPQVWRTTWVIDIQPVGSGEAAIKYLARYVYRTALGSERIVRDEGGKVAFTYRESGTGARKVMELEAGEFIRRFLQHVLPKGFQRVRYYGWLASAASARLDRLRALLDWREPELKEAEALPPPKCPCCGRPMFLVGRFERGPPG